MEEAYAICREKISELDTLREEKHYPSQKFSDSQICAEHVAAYMHQAEIPAIPECTRIIEDHQNIVKSMAKSAARPLLYAGGWFPWRAGKVVTPQDDTLTEPELFKSLKTEADVASKRASEQSREVAESIDFTQKALKALSNGSVYVGQKTFHAHYFNQILSRDKRRDGVSYDRTNFAARFNNWPPVLSGKLPLKAEVIDRSDAYYDAYSGAYSSAWIIKTITTD